LKQQLFGKIQDRSAVVGLIGLGYVGLPLAVEFAKAGFKMIEAASTKPYGFMKFTPGPGIGGHCIPIDPLYLSWKLKALNEEGKALKGAKVLVLGVTYKKDVNDLRESPALDVMTTLLARHAAVSYHDPYVPQVRLDGYTLQSVPLTAETLVQTDCVVVITDHSVFDWAWIEWKSQLIVDARNVLKSIVNGAARLVKL
jgi:UDP-N-acetyl-D-glucosamine dehydrogenase